MRGCFNESKHTLVRSAQAVIAEARAYTTTEVQYEKTNGHDEGHFYIRFPRTRGLPPHKRRHTQMPEMPERTLLMRRSPV